MSPEQNKGLPISFDQDTTIQPGDIETVRATALDHEIENVSPGIGKAVDAITRHEPSPLEDYLPEVRPPRQQT